MIETKPKKTEIKQIKNDPLDILFKEKEADTVDTNTEHLKEMFKMIYSKDNIELKTDLTRPLITSITKMKTYASVFGIKVVDQIATAFMELSVSNSRLGRKEFTEISKSVNQSQSLETPTINERLFGKR